MDKRAEQWLEEISPDQLPEPFKSMVNDCQVPIKYVIVLARHFGGGMVYFPKLDKALIRIRDEKIRKEFNGHNYRDLARKYGITESWVREIVANTMAARGMIQETLFG